MKFTSAIVSLALATSALAAPLTAAEIEERSSTRSAFTPTPIFGCILPFQAKAIVNAFNYLLANPKAANFAGNVMSTQSCMNFTLTRT